MSSEDIENKINETRNKITVETKLFIGLLNMFKMLKDKHGLQQCENQIQEQTNRLQFLKTEYEKLNKNKEEMEKENYGTDNNKNNNNSKLSELENMFVLISFIVKVHLQLKKLHTE
jgi:septal ring factor EnvC (AmiA/AmiB activator)